MNRKTLTIKTGRRTWNLTIIGQENGHWILESDSGLTYWLSSTGVTLTGRNRTETRTYNWAVTNGKELRAALPAMRKAA